MSIHFYTNINHPGIPASVNIQKIATGFNFTEGPCWHKDHLFFSDIPANKMYAMAADGKVNAYIENSGQPGHDDALLSDMIGSNGLTINNKGEFIFCQHGNHAIAKRNDGGNITVITNHYEDRLLNSPNDVVLAKDGSIYFTDPPYGLKNQVLHPAHFQPYAGVYCYQNNTTSLISTDLRYPNGICFSNNEQFLYVSSNHHDEPYLWQYELDKKGGIITQTIFIQQNADGIKTDKHDNLYLATKDGVMIVSPAGKRIALIPIPEMSTNITWGPGDRFSMYVTAGGSIYHLHEK